jgi:uncharacterized protein YcbX
VGRVAWITIAPVKGLALVERDSVHVEPFGVRDNRRLYLLDDDGRMLNGKRLGHLVRVVPELDDEAGTLTLRFPDGRVVEGPVELGEAISVNFYGKRDVPGRVVAGPWTEALSEEAGMPLRLVRPDEPGAGVDRGRGAVTLLSTGSLSALAGAGGLDAVDGRRFRMLFGVDGVTAHEEDSWLGRRVRLGEAVVVPRGNVGRCVVTTVNPDSGERDLDTLRILKDYRDTIPTTEPLPFGVYGEVAEPGRVRVGDPVEPD